MSVSPERAERDFPHIWFCDSCRFGGDSCTRDSALDSLQRHLDQGSDCGHGRRGLVAPLSDLVDVYVEKVYGPS